eukprot:56941_1
MTTEEPNDIISSELDTEKATKSLNRKFKLHKSQSDIEKQGIIPPNYFEDPIATTNNINFGHDMVSPHQEELETLNIIPPNYFEDPIASTKGKSLVKQMISSNLEEHKLNDKVSHNKRETITDLGDMHVIPHDYLDNLLDEAVANHRRKQSRMDFVQNRLEKHLPQPVAATLAETLITSVHSPQSSQSDQDNQQLHTHTNDNNNNNNDNINIIDNNNDDEWQISFVYEPM